MKGIEISRAYYERYGKEMLEAEFPELEKEIAVGLVGAGSECFGFDDGISRDHDFEPGFCIFVPDGIDSKTEFRLERAYSGLRKEFEGLKRSLVSPVGGNRLGVIKIGDFLEQRIGRRTVFDRDTQWFGIPSNYLAELTNGEIFYDGFGEITEIRQKLADYPEDVKLKKLAGHLLLMAQSGQYNYNRCLAHGEPAAAQLAVGQFVENAMSVAFLLNGRYMPYYKWSFRALRELPEFSAFAETFEFMLTTDNSPDIAEIKYGAIEDVAGIFIGELQSREMTSAICGDLEKHAYSVNDRIKNPDVRNLNVLFAV